MTRRVLVTGASSGIGQATVERLLAKGHPVSATARKPEDLARIEALGAQAVRLDLLEPKSIAACAETVLDQGDLGAVVHNAGLGIPGPVETLRPEGWEHQFQVNVFGALELTRVLLPHLLEVEGRAVFVSSQQALLSMPLWGAYAASKMALEGAVDALRIETLGTGFRPVLVQPGPIPSRFPSTARAMAEEYANLSTSRYAEAYAAVAGEYEVGLIARPPEAVARAVEKALTRRRPRARYVVGYPTYVGARLARLLPTPLFDRVIRWYVGL